MRIDRRSALMLVGGLVFPEWSRADDPLMILGNPEAPEQITEKGTLSPSPDEEPSESDPEPNRPRYQIVMTTIQGCPPCQAWKSREAPLLDNHGLHFGPEETSEVFDLDAGVASKRWPDAAAYFRRLSGSADPFRTFPGWLMIVDGQCLWVRNSRERYPSNLRPGQHTALSIASWYKRRSRDKLISVVSCDEAQSRQSAGAAVPARPFRRSPVKRPGGNWTYSGGCSGSALRNHVVRVHGVPRDRVKGLSDRELRIVHSNCHNGHPAFGSTATVKRSVFT